MQTHKAIEKFIQDRVRRGCAKSSVNTYQWQLKLFEDYVRSRRLREIEQVKTRQLEDYIADLRARPKINRNGALSPVTVRKHTLALRCFFRFLKRVRIVSRDPSAGLHIPSSGTRQPKVLSPCDVRKLFDRSKWTDDGNVARDYALLLLFLDSGLRLAEMTALGVDDLDFTRGIVRVQHGKGDKERYSVFARQTACALRSVIGKQGSVFGLSRLAMYRVVVRRGKQTGVRVSPHRLRHTWLTEFLNNGGPIHVAQMLAGHDDLKTTMGYLGVALGRVARSYAQYSPVQRLNGNFVPEEREGGSVIPTR